MVAVGLWAALKGGRALWVWPAAFVGVMLIGGALGMAHVAVPFVEPAILASVVALGLLVALAVDLPVWAGAAIVAVFALLHGHAHGTEVAETMSGAEYMAGFALATATLHALGIGFALTDGSARNCARSSASPARSASLIGAGLYDRSAVMIPGEMFIKDGEIELNAGRKTVTLTRRQFRRPADPGRLALPFLRDQPGAEIRAQKSARHAARYRRRHRGALRAGADARGHAGRARRQAHDLRVPQDVMGKI